MKRILLSLALAGLSLNAPCIDWGWVDIGRNAQAGYACTILFNSAQSISVIRYKASSYRTEIVNDMAEEADSTSALAVRHDGIGAVNGSYFDVAKLTPATYVKNDGIVEGATAETEKFRTDGIVAIRGRHKLTIKPCDVISTERCREALASGPILIQNGSPVRSEWPDRSFFTERHPRTIVGTSSDGWVYFIVIDGRAPGNADGATIAEAVEIAMLFNLENAINLDGGGSSTLWTKEGGVLSHPCDNRRFDHYGQRKIPNAIIFR